MALSLAFLSASYSNSQNLDPATGLALSSTGNVLNLATSIFAGTPPWSGTVSGAAGGMNGGPGPAYNFWTGNIIFSYGLSTASQMVAINTALAIAGTGIQLSGYQYSWQIHNDLNNWASNRGTLTGNVSLIGSTGSVLESFNYNYNQNLPSLTTFSGTQFFNSRYDPSALSGINVSFTGRDQNFWAGYYGPRVHVDSLSLLYTAKPVAADPCANNYVYNPQCPNSSLPVAVAPPVQARPPPVMALSSIDMGGVQLSSSGVINVNGLSPSPTAEPPPGALPGPGAPPSPGQAPSPGAPPGPSQGPSQLATASAGPAQQQGGGKSSSGPSSLAMSVVSRVQAADRATQASAVSNAQQVVATSSSKAQDEANKVVEQANSLSAESSQASQTMASATIQQNNSQQQTTSSSSAVALQGPTVMSVQALTAAANSSQATANTGAVQRIENNNVDASIYSLASSNVQRYTPGISVNSQINGAPVVAIPTMPIQQRQEFKFDTRTEQEQPQIFQLPQTAMTRGSVINDILEQRLNIGSMQMEQQMDTVKKNVLPNDLAGGVDIAAMAMIPKGYEVYSIVTLRDVPFYKPEAIYKNQVNVDNAKVLRQLSSDKLHQDLVNLQYK